MKKNVIIFFPNHHLAYSPTTINLYRCLEKKYHVKIIAPFPTQFNNKELINFNVAYFNEQAPTPQMKVRALAQVLFKNIIPFLTTGKALYTYSALKFLLKYDAVFKKAHREHKDDIIIAVDIIFLKIAARYFKQVHFVSLELTDELLPVLTIVPDKKIASVIIQSRDRYQYLFPNRELKVFYIQNAVFFDDNQVRKVKQKNTVVFNGTASGFFGVFYFLDFIKAYGHTFTGIIKGAILGDVLVQIKERYAALLERKQLVLDDSYTETRHLVEYISTFETGICFYDIASIKTNTFNYLSAPSGKMFTYFAAGVPVIGSNIPGLKIIEDFGAGVLLGDYSPESIYKATQLILSDYNSYVRNCLKAAAHFSFDKQAEGFVDFLGEAEAWL